MTIKQSNQWKSQLGPARPCSALLGPARPCSALEMYKTLSSALLGPTLRAQTEGPCLALPLGPARPCSALITNLDIVSAQTLARAYCRFTPELVSLGIYLS